MTTYYKLTIKGMTGAAYASYRKGILHVAVNELAQPATGNWQPATNLPLSEQNLKSAGFEFKELKPSTVSAKCALFIMMFKEYRNVVYTPSKIERANLKLVTCNQELLKTYFTAKDYPLAGPKSITDYIRNYNAVRDLATNGKPMRVSFPDVYDRDYERTLGDNTAKLQLYWAHLRSKGWAKIDGTWVIKQMHNKDHYES
jgi:hypothetical protein